MQISVSKESPLRANIHRCFASKPSLPPKLWRQFFYRRLWSISWFSNADWSIVLQTANSSTCAIVWFSVSLSRKLGRKRSNDTRIWWEISWTHSLLSLSTIEIILLQNYQQRERRQREAMKQIYRSDTSKDFVRKAERSKTSHFDEKRSKALKKYLAV